MIIGMLVASLLLNIFLYNWLLLREMRKSRKDAEKLSPWVNETLGSATKSEETHQTRRKKFQPFLE